MIDSNDFPSADLIFKTQMEMNSTNDLTKFEKEIRNLLIECALDGEIPSDILARNLVDHLKNTNQTVKDIRHGKACWFADK